MFFTAQPHPHVRFRRAIERRALWMAEDAARELPNLPLEDLLQLVHLYAEWGRRSSTEQLCGGLSGSSPRALGGSSTSRRLQQTLARPEARCS
jgi:hypothetical protein